MSGHAEHAAALDKVIAIAEEAAHLIRGIYEEGNLEVEYKGKDDPVTRADKAANALIVERLSVAFPGAPIVAEESDPATWLGHERADRVFFVDPLDGTQEFVRRSGEFAVMIGMIEHGRPVLGVVTRPLPFVTYAGGPGLGAFLLEGGVRMPISVHDARSLSEADVVISRSHRSPEIDAALAKLGARNLLPYGSAGLKAIKVATGEVDLYAQTRNAGKRWDACAPEAIVVGAGGVLTDAKGKLLDYRATELANVDGVLSGPPATHREALVRLGYG